MPLSIGAKRGNSLNKALGARHAKERVDLSGRNRSDRLKPKGEYMKYIISWFERPQGSPIEYENAKKRILEVFGQWKAPANFKIEFFVIRVGE